MIRKHTCWDLNDYILLEFAFDNGGAVINGGQWTIVDNLLGYNGISGFVPRKLGLPCQTITNISAINIYQLFYFYGHLDISSILWCLYI